MTIYVQNFSASDHKYTVLDQNAGGAVIVNNQPIAAQAQLAISVTEKDGWGKIAFKNEQQAGYTQSSYLKDGDVVKM